MKQLLNLGKGQVVYFAGQIADLSLCMFRDNFISIIKRFEFYETIGGLFADIKDKALEFTVAQRFWATH